jgi:hypothetical protein
MREGDSVEAGRLTNAAARLLSAFQDAMPTPQQLRTGGNQTRGAGDPAPIPRFARDV